MSVFPTPCRNRACPEVTQHDSGYCGEHRPEKWGGDDRPSAAERGYDRHWQKVRAAYVKRHPLCEWCRERGETVEVEIVDHIVPLAGGGARLDFANLQSLCRPCHGRKTEAGR